MNIREHNKRLDALEEMVDQTSLPMVIALLAEMCSAKADHIREAWQDEALAKEWDDNAAKMLRVEYNLRLNRPIV